jgi:hypothetical protein
LKRYISNVEKEEGCRLKQACGVQYLENSGSTLSRQTEANARGETGRQHTFCHNLNWPAAPLAEYAVGEFDVDIVVSHKAIFAFPVFTGRHT